MNPVLRAEVDRLSAALADLLAREAVAARRGSGLAVRAVQARLAPLVRRLAELAAGAADPTLIAACAEIRRRREENRQLMEAARERLRAAIAAKSAHLARLGQVAPAYRPRHGVASRLDVAL